MTAVNRNAPIGHDITSITLLAPTTSLGVSGFRSANGEDVPSIGGGSVAENAYYINGLNITNPDTYVGSARVPFYFYKTVDVQTGGYPAEFGRATGGVINATTKSGTNDPFIALHVDWEPTVAREPQPEHRRSQCSVVDRQNRKRPTQAGHDRSRRRDHSGPLVRLWPASQAQRQRCATGLPALSTTYCIDEEQGSVLGRKD